MMSWPFVSFDRWSDCNWTDGSQNYLPQTAQKPAKGQRCSDSNKKFSHLSYCFEFQVQDILEQDLLYCFIRKRVVCGALRAGSGHHRPHCPMFCWRGFWPCLEGTGRSWPRSLGLQNRSSPRPLICEGTQAPQPALPAAPIQFIMFFPVHLWFLRNASSASSRRRLRRPKHPRGGMHEAFCDDGCEAEILKCLCSLVLTTQDHQQL